MRIYDFLFPANFVILDMPEDSKKPLLLGRPFLAKDRALIDVKLGELILRFKQEKVMFNVLDTMNHGKENAQCYKIDIVEETVQ